MARRPGMVRMTKTKGMQFREARREALIRAAQFGGWLLVPASIFWLLFVVGVIGITDAPLVWFRALPEFLQALLLLVLPILALAAGVVRVFGERGAKDRVRKATWLTAFSLVFVVLAVIGTVQAA